MTIAAHQYKLQMNALLLRREMEGPLDPREEARCAGLLDDFWHQMTDAEQDEVERLFAPTRQPPIGGELSAVDRPVKKGAHTAPRSSKAA